MACRVSGPSGERVPAARAAPHTAASTMPAVAGAWPASRRLSRCAARVPSSRAAGEPSLELWPHLPSVEQFQMLGDEGL